MRLTKITLALLSAGALGAGGFAGTALAAGAMRAPAAQLPAEVVQGQVRYVSGGIGHDEAMAFERAERRYPLSLEFAQRAKPRNEFTADVKVMIRDAKGKLALHTVSQGPFLLAKLLAGRYDVKATQDGRTLDRHVVVADGKHAHVGFLWPQA